MIKHHFYEHSIAKLGYYKFGSGDKVILSFHGYGMHGKQFQILENYLGDRYTFYGFDLFFHQRTQLSDESLNVIKKGITKLELSNFIKDFCTQHQIKKFSILSYSMGTHYATAVTEELGDMITQYIAVAPSCLNPGRLVNFFSKSGLGNFLLQKIVLSPKVLMRTMLLIKKFKLIDETGYQIFMKEIGTPQLRFNLYANFTYLRFLETDFIKLKAALNNMKEDSIFIFGSRDPMYGPKIGKRFLKELTNVKTIILDENHDMINANFAEQLTEALS